MPQAGLIDGLQFARDASRRAGRLALGELGRLAAMQCNKADLDYRLQGGIDGDGKAYLDLEVDGRLELTCQRCLGRLDWPVELGNRLELAGTWGDVVNPVDDDVERVLAEKDMDVAALVEDEVILSLPMAPRHEQCGKAAQAGTGRESPFSVLAGLKKGAAK